MKVLAAIIASLFLHSCTATYDSPRTGIKYRVEVPITVLDQYLHIETSPRIHPQK